MKVERFEDRKHAKRLGSIGDDFPPLYCCEKNSNTSINDRFTDSIEDLQKKKFLQSNTIEDAFIQKYFTLATIFTTIIKTCNCSGSGLERWRLECLKKGK